MLFLTPFAISEGIGNCTALTHLILSGCNYNPMKLESLPESKQFKFCIYPEPSLNHSDLCLFLSQIVKFDRILNICVEYINAMGWWGGVVAHEILVSAQGPLVLGFWVWGLRVWGLGLTIVNRKNGQIEI